MAGDNFSPFFNTSHCLGKRGTQNCKSPPIIQIRKSTHYGLNCFRESLKWNEIWRTFTVLGTSFPETMASIKKRGEIVPRHEWQLYKILVNNFQKVGLRLPTFGDYAISHPQ